ncbi:MAG: chromophore lyase CpcT/CpeT [Cyanobacteriota bacterium]
MTFSPELTLLAQYMAGEFENREQAAREPAWYVNLRLWLRPLPLFAEDSLTLFAEQANILQLDRPYRPRILRLRHSDTSQASLMVQYYMLKDPDRVRGAGQNPALLKTLTPEQMELLPGCTLTVTQQPLAQNTYSFSTTPATDAPCCFTYQEETYQVSLGFEARHLEFRSYDKGIDPQTGRAIWGALLGPYIFMKREDFSAELAM